MKNPQSIDMTWLPPLYTTRIKSYPGGKHEVLICNYQNFREPGYKRLHKSEKYRIKQPRGETDVERSKRRARTQVRDMALCTPMKYFVTFTLDQTKIDRYDIRKITARLNKWLSNAVERKGLTYIMVPEYHKDGAIHFHGLFSESELEVVDSGTMTKEDVKKPKRVPRKKKAEYLAEGWRVVYNMPQWPYGWTTAIEVYGDYSKAVNYVTKYISKSSEKVGGRWYYSGGKLNKPLVSYMDLNYCDYEKMEGAYRFEIEGVGRFVRLEASTTEIEDIDVDGYQQYAAECYGYEYEEMTKNGENTGAEEREIVGNILESQFEIEMEYENVKLY